MGNLNFDTSEAPAQNMDFEPLPPGRYLAQVSASDVKTTQAGDGYYLQLTFDVQEPGYEGRKVWTNLNIKNKNPKAEQIAKGMLSALCKACGKVGFVDDSSDLHDIPVIIKVAITEGKAGYEARNEVKAFYAATPEKPAKVSAKKKTLAPPVEEEEDAIPF